MQISIDCEICQTRLARIELEREGCKARTLTTTPSQPHCAYVKVSYLNRMHEKNAVERYA